MKSFFKTLFFFFLWALFALLIVSWAFDRKTDPAPEKQIVLCADGCPADTKALEKRLIGAMPEGIEYVRVRMLAYSFFDTNTGLPEADLYILPGSEAAEYKEMLAPVCVLYDANAGEGLLREYFAYTEGGAAGESYTLYYRERGLGEAHAAAVKALAEEMRR